MNKVKKEQVPQSEKSESKTSRVVSQQNATEGQKKEASAESYLVISKLVDILKNVSFPAPKNEILEYISQSEDFSEKNRIVNALNNLKDRTYNGVADLTTSAGLVQQ